MESQLLGWLRGRIAPHPRLPLGIGDDAALVHITQQAGALVTVDLLHEGTDFRLDGTDPRRIGRKALAVNLSDLAAMAGRPTAAVVALLLPRRRGLELAIELSEGFLPLAEQYDTPVAGGDINSWEGPLVISITVLGEPTARGALTRRGAKPGDAIVVTGSFGGSILGRHLDFEPRVREALLLHERYRLHAGIDVSDGLSLDLARLAAESGCGAAIELERVPVSAAAVELAGKLADGSTPLDHALGDGEDFELVLAVPPDEAERMCAEQPLGVCLTRIGQFVPQPGLWERRAGELRPLEPHGWEHRLEP